VQVKKQAPQRNLFKRDWICVHNLLTILEEIVMIIKGGGGGLMYMKELESISSSFGVNLKL
jgi:hypothetical protein